MNKLHALAIATSLLVGGLFNTAAHADSLQRWVDVVNFSDLAIYKVQITNIDDPKWGRDLLGSGVIMGNDEARLEPHRPNGYCRFDVRVTYENGSEVELYDVNLCSAVAIGVDDDGYNDIAYA